MFLNPWAINSDPYSYVISNGQRYLYNHIVSTKSAIIIYFLSQCCIISNHTVTGSIIVTGFKVSISFTFICIFMGLLDLQRGFHDVLSAKLAGNLPFFVGHFARFYVPQFVTSFWTEGHIPIQYKC